MTTPVSMTTPVPPTLSYASSYSTGNCTLCRVRPVWKKPLYGLTVCQKCYYRFASRRQLAYLIDGLIFFVPVLLGTRTAMAALTAAKVQLDPVTLEVGGSAVGAALLCLFVCKDGFNGQSPGKWLTGVQVVAATTGRPIGFGQSFKRNAPLFFAQIPYAGRYAGPLVVLIMALQLNRGNRLGDGWANTRVIWKKYADRPLFRQATPSTSVA